MKSNLKWDRGKVGPKSGQNAYMSGSAELQRSLVIP